MNFLFAILFSLLGISPLGPTDSSLATRGDPDDNSLIMVGNPGNPPKVSNGFGPALKDNRIISQPRDGEFHNKWHGTGISNGL